MLVVRDVEVLVEHGDLMGGCVLLGFPMRGDRLEAGDELSAVELGDLREEEPHCLLVVLEVAHWVRPVLGPLEDELPQVGVALQVFYLVQLPKVVVIQIEVLQGWLVACLDLQRLQRHQAVVREGQLPQSRG